MSGRWYTQIGPYCVVNNTKNLNQHKVMEKIKEKLCCFGGDSMYEYCEKNKIHIYIGNRKLQSDYEEISIGGYDCEFTIVDIPEETERCQIRDFQKQYREELDALEKEYGDIPIVKWGLISDYH